MRGPTRQAVSLIEVLIAAAILALAILPMITAMNQSTEALQQTLPYHQAVFFAEKCLEDSRVGASEDPYYVDRLIQDKLGATSAPVVNGKHYFFNVLEDSAEPSGRILPGQDWSIQDEVGPLFQQAKDMRVRVVGDRDPKRQFGICDISLDWRDLRRKDLNYRVATPLKIWIPLSMVEPPLPEDLDSKLGDVLEPGAGRSLPQIIESRVANEEKLRAFARVLYYGGVAAAGFPDLQKEMDSLRKNRESATGEAEVAALTGRIGRLDEQLATLHLGLIQQLKGPLSVLAGGINKGGLGKPNPNFDQRKRAVDQVRLVFDRYFDWMSRAQVEYGTLVNVPGLPTSWKLEAHLALLRILSLAALTYPWDKLDPLRDYLKGLREFYRGRMPNIEHYLQVEEEHVDYLADAYPLGPAAKEFRETRDIFLKAALKLLLFDVVRE